MYIGQTGDAFNCRFNRHRSDILCYPNRRELPKHFCYGDCVLKQTCLCLSWKKLQDLNIYKNTKKINGLCLWILLILMV